MILPIIYAGIGIAFFTSLILLTRRPFKLKDKVVIVFMIFLTLPMLFKLINHMLPPCTGYIISHTRLLPLGFGPCLYLYALIMTGEMPDFNKKFLIHFIPLVFAFVILMFFNSGRPDHPAGPSYDIMKRTGIENNYDHVTTTEMNIRREKPGVLLPENESLESIFPGVPPAEFQSNQIHKSNGKFDDLNGPRLIENIIRGIIVLSFISYTIALLFLLRRHYRKIEEYFSYNSIMVNLGWLKWITICFFVSYGFVIVSSFVSPAYLRIQILNPFFTPDIGTVFFIIIFSLFAIKQPVIFAVEGSDSETVTGKVEDVIDKNKRKYEKSGLKDEDAQIYFKTLEEHMISEKPYLDSDLTIIDLSEKLNIPKHYVTEIINKKFDKNFYMFVNYYRIEEAKKKLSDENFKEHSIIRIAYDCGFNSKSTFNSVFKKFTDLTPTDYRVNSIQGGLIQ